MNDLEKMLSGPRESLNTERGYRLEEVDFNTAYQERNMKYFDSVKEEIRKEIKTGNRSERYARIPGNYRASEGIFGSRRTEFMKIAILGNRLKEFAELDQKIHKKSLHIVLPKEIQERADKISQEIYREHLKNYDIEDMNVSNSVGWLKGPVMDCTKAYFDTVNRKGPDGAVAMVNDRDLMEDGKFRSRYVSAIHEITHVEQYSPDFDPKDERFHEIIPCLQDIIITDEIYKKAKDMDIEEELDYGTSIKISDQEIQLGEMANFYRELESEKGTLGDALVSEESLAFLGL